MYCCVWKLNGCLGLVAADGGSLSLATVGLKEPHAVVGLTIGLNALFEEFALLKEPNCGRANVADIGESASRPESTLAADSGDSASRSASTREGPVVFSFSGSSAGGVGGRGGARTGCLVAIAGLKD